MVQTRSGLDLILCVGFRYNGRDLTQATVAAERAEAPCSAVARGSGSPEFTVNGAPGVKLTRAWVWDDQRATTNSPRHWTRLGDALGCVCTGDGGFVQQSSPACTC